MEMQELAQSQGMIGAEGNVGSEAASPEEEAQLERVMAHALDFLSGKGQQVLIQEAEKNGPAQAMAVGAFTVLSGIYEKAAESGENIPMSVFAGEGGALTSFLEYEGQMLEAHGFEDALSDEVLDTAYAQAATRYGQQQESSGNIKTKEQQQEWKEMMNDPSWAGAAQELMQRGEGGVVEGQAAMNPMSAGVQQGLGRLL